MKRITLFLLAIASCLGMHAEDGSRLWLRYDKVQKAQVSGPECLAAEELRNYYPGDKAALVIDPTIANDEGYRINGSTVSAKTEMGLLYGAYALLRGEQGASAPYYKLRILNHWDNLDSSIERGYAGLSIFWALEDPKTRRNSDLWKPKPINTELIKAYARANHRHQRYRTQQCECLAKDALRPLS